jgi:uncharacterized membrane-anchored protein YhcB (DUF1043 family)
MTNPRFRFGQIIGIVAGVIIGSMAISLLLGPRRQPDYYNQGYPNINNQYNQQMQQQGVFEQMLSMPASSQPPSQSLS